MGDSLSLFVKDGAVIFGTTNKREAKIWQRKRNLLNVTRQLQMTDVQVSREEKLTTEKLFFQIERKEKKHIIPGIS